MTRQISSHSRAPLVRASALLIATTFVLLAAFNSSAQNPLDPNSKDRELIARAPYDKIILIDDTQWEIEPLAPRPLPPYDPKKKPRPKAADELVPREGNIGLPGEKSTFEMPKAKSKEQEAEQITIHTLEGDLRDFYVKREHIKKVLYFEDLLVAEANKQISAGQYRKAFEYLLLARARNPKWPGIEDTVDRLLFEEGSQSMNDNEHERGLRLLTELYTRKPNYPGLADKFAPSFATRINSAFDLGAYAKGRQVLHELESFAPDHLVVKNSRAKFEARTRDLVNRATGLDKFAKVDMLVSAAEIWPKYQGLDATYREAFAAAPTVDVAVSELPTPVGPWNRSSAYARTVSLLYRPILAAATEDALKGNPPNQLASRVETFDLARGMRIRLKPGFVWNDGSRPVSVIDVARSLADRAVPTLPGYNARWADLVERVEVTEDEQIEVRLGRASLRPEQWLVAPVGPAHAAGDGWVATPDQGRQPVGDGPFRWAPSTNKAIHQYVSVAADASPGSNRIQRVREIRYDSHAAALAAFIRGDVSVIESLPADRVPEISARPLVKVGKYAAPSLHRIALDGRTITLRNRSLRRALSLAIDRKTLLEESVLRRPSDQKNTVSDGPFLKGSYADVPDVLPLTYDPLLSKMLVAAARKELSGTAIKLTLEYPPTPAARAVCPKLAEAWTLVGLEIVLREVPEGQLEAKLRSGGRFDLAYCASRPGEPAIDAGPTICPAYDAAPGSDPLASLASPRILQLLMELDRAPETTQSHTLVLQIDRETRDELPILPLWQVEDYYGYRTRVKGMNDTRSHLYQGIESWEVEPWFPNDPW